MKNSCFLTPWNQKKLCVFGAAYDSSGLIITSSLRRSQYARYKPSDPAYLDNQSMAKAEYLNGNYIYLGHLFRIYGHFLLETLPMLAGLVNDPYSKGIFTSWGGSHNRVLLDRFLDLLFIDKKRVYVHANKLILKCQLEIRSRPVTINHPSSLDTRPYSLIIKQIKQQICPSTDFNHVVPIFLSRKSSRTSSVHTDAIETFARSLGFKLVRPENLSLQEQIELISNAPIVAGFSGSQLHNTIFSSSNTTVIEIGDSRMPLKANPNQLICNKISSSSLLHVPFHDNPAMMCQGFEAVFTSLK